MSIHWESKTEKNQEIYLLREKLSQLEHETTGKLESLQELLKEKESEIETGKREKEALDENLREANSQKESKIRELERKEKEIEEFKEKLEESRE